MRQPSDAAVKRVMRDTGMEYMQAYNHLKARNSMRERINNDGFSRDSLSMSEWRESNPPVHGCGHMQGRGAA